MLRRIKPGRAILFMAALAASACVLAYEIGGHHFALVSIYLDGIQSTPERSQASHLELFCAELPDLAMELDAVTQRQHVFNSGEFQWGLLGRCTGPVTKHMFATQYYLHGLTGDMKKPKGVKTNDRLREAVRAMVERIDGELATAAPADKLVRVCARGFVAHLLGDSFAHAQLYSPSTRYAPGTGHWKHNHDPDYLLSREILTTEFDYSQAWFKEAASILVKRDAPAMLATQVQRVLEAWRSEPDDEYGETKLTEALISNAPQGWKFFDPPLQKWRPDGIDGILLQEKCDDQMRKAFPSDADRPSCAAVWSYYRDTAISAFKSVDLDPIKNAGYGSCNAERNELKHGEKP